MLDGYPEVWGGIECSVVRIGSSYRDQAILTGHNRRPEDLHRVARLGIRTIRYPVVWETHALEGEAAWRRTTRRLEAARDLGLRVFAGLCHHGSGPPHAALGSPAFVDGLVAFARDVAARFPWLHGVTPLNEPLTTSRFAMLYGHWYPHVRDDGAFVDSMIRQALASRATVRAMREAIPALRFLQTEDLTEVQSSPELSYQADFENQRRWLTFDLLTGRMRPGHPLWSFVARSAGTAAALDDLARDPLPPDVLGLNYYVTSERFLEVARPPVPAWIGGNGRDRYRDIETVRSECPLIGRARLAREAWDRYGIPLAFAEVQLAGHREEQMRWFAEAWEDACALRRDDVNVEAVTAWALFGAVDWDSLMVASRGRYEAGAFDARASVPRITGLGHLVAETAAGRTPRHPVLSTPGWWHRDGMARHDAPPVLVTGATHGLTRVLLRCLGEHRIPALHISARRLQRGDDVREVTETSRPWAIIHLGSGHSIDEAETRVLEAYRGTVTPATLLAREAAACSIPFVLVSSDQVFGEDHVAPITEFQPLEPVNVSGRVLAAAEAGVRNAYPRALIARLGAVFGLEDREDLVSQSLEQLSQGEPATLPHDVVVSPIYAGDAAAAIIELLLDREEGIWHLAAPVAFSWLEHVRRIAYHAGISLAGLTMKSRADLPWMAPRPAFSALASTRGTVIPPLNDSIGRFIETLGLEERSLVHA